MGQPLTELPTWQGEPIKLFTVFSAVNDRGGYEKVKYMQVSITVCGLCNGPCEKHAKYT